MIKIISAKVRFDVKVPLEEVETILTPEGGATIGSSILIACMENAKFDFDNEENFHVHGDLLIKDIAEYTNMMDNHRSKDIAFVPISELPGFRKK